jgi:transcriptional regulator with XRE-family HTH domain
VTEKLRRMIDRALDSATADLQKIADDAGISYDTLWAWKTGRRNPSAENLRKLALAIERRGTELAKLAGELERAAKDLERE